MAVSDILNEIDDLIASSKHMPFTNQSIINEVDLINLLDELRHELPTALANAAKIVEDRDNIIERAREEADRILKDAKAYADSLIEETAVKREADERARRVLEQALTQEKEIKERTMKEAYQLRDNSYRYANSVFDTLIGTVGSSLNTLEQAKKELNRGAAGE